MIKFGDIISAFKDKKTDSSFPGLLVNLVYSVVVSCVICVYLAIPVFSKGTSGIFYSTDPDVVYVANSLSYIKNGNFGYFDHPGTLSISFISFLMLPLRVFSKLILHQNFINVAFNNIETIFIFVRVLQILTFSAGLTFFGLAVFYLTKSRLLQILSPVMLLTFQPILHIAASISAEPLSFLLSSLWILLCVIFLKNDKKWMVLLLGFISGLMFANRATTLFYSLMTLTLLFRDKLDLRKLARLTIMTLISICIGFYIGIFPLKRYIPQILSRVFTFGLSSEVHSNRLDLVNINAYLNSANTFVVRDGAAVVVFVLFVFILLSNVSIQNKKLFLPGLIVLGATLIYAKFPLGHYQIPNYVFIVFLVSHYVSKFNKSVLFVMFSIVVILVSHVYASYRKEVVNTVEKVYFLENFVRQMPDTNVNVWEWARSRDFALLWIRDWSGGVFDEQLLNERSTFELAGDFQNIRIGNSKKVSLDEYCWNNLFIQKESIDKFKKLNNKYTLTDFNYVQGTGNIYHLKNRVGDCDQKQIKMLEF